MDCRPHSVQPLLATNKKPRPQLKQAIWFDESVFQLQLDVWSEIGVKVLIHSALSLHCGLGMGRFPVSRIYKVKILECLGISVMIKVLLRGPECQISGFDRGSSFLIGKKVLGFNHLSHTVKSGPFPQQKKTNIFNESYNTQTCVVVKQLLSVLLTMSTSFLPQSISPLVPSGFRIKP